MGLGRLWTCVLGGEVTDLISMRTRARAGGSANFTYSCSQGAVTFLGGDEVQPVDLATTHT